MDAIDIELRKVVDLATRSSIDVNEVTSLRDLYFEKRDSLHLSDRQIQIMLGMDRNTLDPIIKAEAKRINFINLVKLAHFLGLSVNDLIKVYIPDMDSKQIGEIQRAREAGYIVENFDVAALVRLKFFKKDSSSKEMTERIKTFFNLDTLYDYLDHSISPAFSRTKRNSSDLIRNFWIKSALVHFQEISNPYTYDRKELVDLISKIRPYTRDVKNGLIKVLKALYRVGVTVIFQESIEKLQVRGATMVCNKKPCIVISDLNKNYPTLWFVLLHELHHILYDLEEISKRTYHISGGEGDLFLMDEEKADDFAQEYLLNETRLKYISGYIASNFHVEQYAKECGLHPSIIYSIYCYKTNEWAFYNKYIPKMDEAIHLLNTHPFEKESLIESAKKIKQIISIDHEE